MHLNRCSLAFDPKKKPYEAPVWMCLSHLPLLYWSEEDLVAINNSLGGYIDKLEPKETLSTCVWIYVCVDQKRDYERPSSLPWMIGIINIRFTVNNFLSNVNISMNMVTLQKKEKKLKTRTNMKLA